ncbi:MAG TPA: DUF4296 domain-containing protein [Moheibacter sp.]|nr:DUF4296 domain-containing protein [Moheibacter sp.]
MKKISFFFLICFSACTNIVEKPDNLIGEEKMTQVLTDFYIHQQASYINEINNKKMDLAKIDAQILKEHQTNAKDFEESFRFYYLHPEIYNEILLAVRDKLEEKLPEAERKKRIEDRKNKEKK